jgi:transposase
MGSLDLGGFSQNPDPSLLIRHCEKNYPGAKVKVAYEAGFCGYGIYRSLTGKGIECIVVNAADVPSSDKERKRKDDKKDARKICRELADGSLSGIYIPDIAMEQVRTLIRQRHRLVKDKVRCQNRIKHMLMFSGVSLDTDRCRWSQKYLDALEKATCGSTILKTALDLATDEYKHIRGLIKKATLIMRKMAQQEPFASVQKYLQTIDGIGLINGMVIQAEVQDIDRFRCLDTLCGYAGFVPDIDSSDERVTISGVTHRCNEFLREAIIESSWMLIRKDPAMLMKYNHYKSRMNANKAIIRIGKHLLARIRHVWKNKQEYQRGIVG